MSIASALARKRASAPIIFLFFFEGELAPEKKNILAPRLFIIISTMHGFYFSCDIDYLRRYNKGNF